MVEQLAVQELLFDDDKAAAYNLLVNINGNNTAGNSDTSDTEYKRVLTCDKLKLTPFVDPMQDDVKDSLLLIKPTNGNNHGGGLIFNSSSQNYKDILRWIKEGARNN